MTDELPFKNCFTVDVDLSFVGLKHAMKAWSDYHKNRPTVIWISSEYESEYLTAITKYFDELNFVGIIKIDPNYTGGMWSLGSTVDKGFGSRGA